jgi:hypothetical protein
MAQVVEHLSSNLSATKQRKHKVGTTELGIQR